MKNQDIEKIIKEQYDVAVPDYWEKIAGAEASETKIVRLDAPARVPRYRRLTPIAACFALLVVAAFIFRPGTSVNGELRFGDGLDTPAVTGAEIAAASFDKAYTLSSAYKESDLVADVSIIEWLYESEETYFRAKINKVYKGDKTAGDEIVLIQAGNSNFTYEEYPLFNKGDRLILNLELVNDAELNFGLDNCYKITGSGQTELQILEINNNLYAYKRAVTPIKELEELPTVVLAGMNTESSDVKDEVTTMPKTNDTAPETTAPDVSLPTGYETTQPPTHSPPATGDGETTFKAGPTAPGEVYITSVPPLGGLYEINDIDKIIDSAGGEGE